MKRRPLPAFRRRQLADARAAQDQRAHQRVGVLMDFDASDDPPPPAPRKPWHHKRHADRLAWLRVRPDLWRGLPTDRATVVTVQQSARLLALVRFMVDDGLFHGGTIPDIKRRIQALIGELRGGDV